MNLRPLVYLAALAVASAPVAAGAQLTQVFSPAGLGGGLTVHTFESGPTGPGASYSAAGGVVTGHACGFAGCVTPSGDNGLTTSEFPRAIGIAFDAPVRAVGLYFGNDDTCCTSTFTAFLDAFDGANLIGTIGVVANMNDFVDQFLGFTSTVDVTSVQVRYGTGTNVSLYHFVDDVQFGPGMSSVPEPATVALVGGGLLALAGIARRRRTS